MFNVEWLMQIMPEESDAHSVLGQNQIVLLFTVVRANYSIPFFFSLVIDKGLVIYFIYLI